MLVPIILTLSFIDGGIAESKKAIKKIKKAWGK
jgi:hypothetical protein